MFSRIEKRKGREEYKEAIKDTLNKLYWESLCVEDRMKLLQWTFQNAGLAC